VQAQAQAEEAAAALAAAASQVLEEEVSRMAWLALLPFFLLLLLYKDAECL
jgi:hypothetical protein